MKILSGAEIAGFIKARQEHQVRSLLQSQQIRPKLAIIQTTDDPVSSLYVKLKNSYAKDIQIEVDNYKIDIKKATLVIEKLNQDRLTHGIIIQLPLSDVTKTDELCSLLNSQKDVDSLGQASVFDAATPQAILWLLAGYNIDLRDKRIVIVGRGKLVGLPLAKMMQNSGLQPIVLDIKTKNIKKELFEADIIISAAGSPRLITSVVVKQGAVVIDAGTASEDGKLVGDIDTELYERQDLAITPQIGGVGPLTICALFDNLIRSATISQ